MKNEVDDTSDMIILLESMLSHFTNTPLSNAIRSFLIPMVIIVVTWVAHHVQNLTCPRSITPMLCQVVAELLSHSFAVAMCFIVIVAMTKAQQMSEIAHRFQAAIELFAASSGEKQKKD